jgi:hypothetical protein
MFEKVENKLFRVPKSGLNVEGTVFETMFALPPPQENNSGRPDAPEGSTDKFPIILEGISKAHFRGFLRAIYPMYEHHSLNPFESHKLIVLMGIRNPASTVSPLTYDELDGAVQLATMWEFREVCGCPGCAANSNHLLGFEYSFGIVS